MISNKTLFHLIFCSTLLISNVCTSQTTTIASGSWGTAAIWSTGTVPGATDDVQLLHNVDIPSTITSPVQVRNLTIGLTASAILTVNNSLSVTTELQIGGDLVIISTGFESLLTCGLRSGVSVAGNVSIVRNHTSSTVAQVGINFLGESFMNVLGNFDVQYLGGSDTFRELRLNRATLTITGDLALRNNATAGTGNLYLEVFSTTAGLFSTVSCRDLIFEMTNAGANQDIIFNCRSGSSVNVMRDFIVNHSGSGDLDMGLGLSGNSGNLNIRRNATLSTSGPGNVTMNLRTNSKWDIDGDANFTASNPADLSVVLHENSELHFGGTLSPGAPSTNLFNFIPDGDPDDNSLVRFDGQTLQSIPGNETYCRLVVDNPSTLDLTGNIIILKEFTMTNGKILAQNRLIDVRGLCTGSQNSYVCDGTLRQILNPGAGPHWFDVGSATKGYSPASLTNLSSTLPSTFEVKYSPTSPNVATAPGPYNNNLKDITLANVSNGEFWIINRTAGNGSANVMLGWNSFSDVNGTALDKLRIARWDGSQWTNTGICDYLGDQSSGQLTTQSGISSFSPFTIASTTFDNVLLPIELIDFRASAEQNRVRLDWETASELNNDCFTVQRYYGGETWQDIKRIEGAGTSHNLLRYSTYDDHPLNGHAYYRLMQTDLDGTISFSKTEHVFFENLISDLTVYPNPFSTQFQITITGLDQDEDNNIVNITLLSALGNVALSLNTKIKNRSITLNEEELQDLPQGFYLVQVSAAEKTFHRKVIKK